IALAIGIVLLYFTNVRQYSTRLAVPFFKSVQPDLLIDRLFPTSVFFLGYVPFLFFIVWVLVGCSNAVNLTDGLDGLAIGCVLVASAALTALTYITGHLTLSDYLDLQYLPRVGEVTIFCGSMVGASLGFLWYN